MDNGTFTCACTDDHAGNLCDTCKVGFRAVDYG